MLDTFNDNLLFDYLDFLTKNYTEEALSKIKDHLNKVVVYKMNTKQFIGKIQIENFSGLSCYVPSQNLATLNYYSNFLEWSKKSGWHLLL